MLSLNPLHRETYQSFEDGILITEEIIGSIKDLMLTSIKNGIIDTHSKEIYWYKSKNRQFVFSLRNAPGLIFKASCTSESTETRYSNMFIGRTICRTHQLGLIVIPNASKFTINFGGRIHTFIAEKKLDFDSELEVQENLYLKQDQRINETIRQLAEFICLTGANHIDWEEIPLLKDCSSEDDYLKVGLINLEQMGNPIEGIFGGFSTRGLLRCVLPSQYSIVLDVVKKHFKLDDRLSCLAESIVHSRNLEIFFNQALDKFHAKKELTGNEPIQLQEGFEGRALEIAEMLIAEANRQIAGKPAHMPLRYRRRILIQPNRHLYLAKDGTRFELSEIKAVIRTLLQKRIFFNVLEESAFHLKLQA